MSVIRHLDNALAYLLLAEERADFVGREELAKKLRVIRRAAAKVLYEESGRGSAKEGSGQVNGLEMNVSKAEMQDSEGPTVGREARPTT